MDEQTLRSPTSAARSQSATLAGAQMQRQRQPGDLPHQRQQYHDTNNNSNGNNNNNNNGKVRLLITPAPATAAAVEGSSSYGSKQQMDRSATTAIITTATLTTTDNIDSHQHQQRSQQNNRQKNYHHYDYYTDSDLTSSLLQPANASTQANINNSNYDQNILLFATEHNQPSRPTTTTTTTNGNNNNKLTRQHLAYGQLLEGAATQGGRHPPSNSPLYSVGSQLYGNNTHTATGKFINHYPSWRQTQSPTTSHPQNYSFHVPLHLQSNHQSRRQHHHSRPQSRYGYVTPTGERAKLHHRSSFKSRTLAHIPQSVRDDHHHQQVSIRLQHRRPIHDPYEKDDDDDDEGEEINYYDQPSLTTRQFMLSEGDLLKVRSVVLDDGQENPFKPGTELSWEAEMMVRLMKRGYPIQELPALVESAKQVAGKRGGGKDNEPPPPAANAAAAQVEELITSGGSGGRQKALQRRRSSHDLSQQVKQVWASSLSRTKSMPRFTAAAAAAATSGDADSIDLLISSIEKEMELEDNDASEMVVEQKTFESSGNMKTPTKVVVSRRKSSGKAHGELEATKSTTKSSQASPKKSNSKQRNASEQQVAASSGSRSNRKSSSGSGKLIVVPLGKKSARGPGKNQQKADLKTSTTVVKMKKRNRDCCSIQ